MNTQTHAPEGQDHQLQELALVVAGKLLDGMEAQAAYEALCQHGVSAPVSEELVDLMVSSPLYAVALERMKRLRRLELALTLLRHVGKDTKVEEASAMPEAGAFFGRHFEKSVPLVIRGFAKEWPTAAWSLKGLGERFAGERVEICMGRDRDPAYDYHWESHREEVQFPAFGAMIFLSSMQKDKRSNDVYMIGKNGNLQKGLAAMLDDVRLPEEFFDASKTKECSSVWLGPDGTVTQAHHDTYNNLFVQVIGEKEVWLAPPMDPWLLSQAHGMQTGADPTDEESRANAGWLAPVKLEAGDALFIPVGWWHYVRSLSAALSLSFWGWKRDGAFDWYRPGMM